MFIIAFVSGILTFLFVKKYSKFMLKFYGLNEEVEGPYDEITYGRHPMSESDSDDSDDSEDSDSLFEYEENPFYTEKEMPCYMKDFYEETTQTEDWLKKSDTEKKKILDEDIDNYMKQDQRSIICDHLKNIKC